MKTIFVVLLTIACTYARPQNGYPPARPRPPAPNQSETRIDSQGTTVTCDRTEVAPGKYEYVCNAQPGTLIEEKTLWIPTSSSDQDLLIRVPNYQFREIIRAGLQAGAAGGTNVKIHVARPEVESLVEGRFEQEAQQAPNVQVTYDGIEQRGEVHYGGTGLAYADYSKPISEPGAAGARG